MYRIIQVVQAAAVETQRPFNPSGSPPVSPQLPFGRRLRELRRAQRALVEEVGIDFTYLSKLETQGWQDDDPALAVYDFALAAARSAMSDALARGADRTVARQVYLRAIVDAVRVLRESPRSAPTAQASL